MAFGDIIQEAHYYRRDTHEGNLAAGSSFTLSFGSPTRAGSAIIVLFNPGFVHWGTSEVFSVTNPNWSFTDRSVLSGSYSPTGRLFDCLNAPVSIGAITVTNISASTLNSAFFVSAYEIDTPNGATFQQGLACTRAEGSAWMGPFAAAGAALDDPEDRRAFLITAMSFATNSGSFGTWVEEDFDYSPITGAPVVKRSYPKVEFSQSTFTMTSYRVCLGTYNRPMPNPADMHFVGAVAGASVESGGCGAQYVEGTDALSTAVQSAATHFGGLGSYEARAANTNDTTFTNTATSSTRTKPSGTVDGDAVFIFIALEKPSTMAGWSAANGDPNDGSWFTLPAGFTVLDSGSFGGWYSSAQDGWPPTLRENDVLLENGTEYPEDRYYLLAVKEASGEGSSYTINFLAGYTGWWGVFTVAAMPESAHNLTAYTAGLARGKDENTGGSAPFYGNTDLFHPHHFGGRMGDTKYYRRWQRQKALSEDYVVIAWHDTGHTGTSQTFDEYPTHDFAMSRGTSGAITDVNDNIKVYNRGSNPDARLNFRQVTNNLTEETGGGSSSFAKAWVVGGPAMTPIEGVKFPLRGVTVSELPYDLRNILLGGELS